MYYQSHKARIGAVFWKDLIVSRVRVGVKVVRKIIDIGSNNWLYSIIVSVEHVLLRFMNRIASCEHIFVGSMSHNRSFPI